MLRSWRATAPDSMVAIDEDTPDAAGQTFSSLLAGQYSDAADAQFSAGNPTGSSPGAFSGVAVTANGSSAGTGQWQYSNDAGAHWHDIGAASDGAALLFNAGTALRFNPAANFNGTAPDLTVHLIDNSLPFSITDAQVVDISGLGATGGGSAYSTGTVVISQDVNAVNDPPVNVVPGVTQNGTEDSNFVFDTAHGNAISVSDVEAASLTVTLSVAHGVLTLAGTTGLSFTTGDGTGDATMTFSGTAAAINTALDGLVYRGDLNYNGADTLHVDTSDNGATGAGGVLIGSDTVAISLAPDGYINGTVDNDTLNGTGGNDTFVLQRGRQRQRPRYGGDDYFYFNGTLTAADQVDGGAGGTDVVGLCGTYNMILGADNLVNIERLTLLSGTVIGGPHVTYTLASVDANVAAGDTLTVLGAGLLSDETMIFNGSAETDGHFYIGGGAANDILVGGQQSDAIVGGAGDDQLYGLAGNDYLVGGAGADTLRGGFGADRFVYLSVGNSTSTSMDHILDFQGTIDRIDLSAIDSGNGGDQAFTFIGANAFDGTAGELRAFQSGGHWFVEADTNGDMNADLVIQVETFGHALVQSDFVL